MNKNLKKSTANKDKVDAKKTKSLSICIYIELVSSIVFSLLSIHFAKDISIAAFPLAALYTAVAVYFVFFKMIRPLDGTKIAVSVKLVEYLPYVMLLAFILRRAGKYGTSFAYDVICVFVWCVLFVLSLVISRMLNEKRLSALTENWNVKAPKKVKRHGLALVLYELLDWVNALVQAVFMVLLIQIFVIQLYVIPSESMVPTFLIKDRVLVTKVNCGPKFPLTEVGLPDFTTYKRGDIVVLRNPHYKIDRKSEVKTVTSQLVYMLTFMKVNLNRDENGEIKADPLVKRIAGIEGEQLVMQDGVLYSRTKGNDEFKPVNKDNQYAAWDLNAKIPMPRSEEARRNYPVKVYPLEDSFGSYSIMTDFEDLRRSFDLTAASYEARDLAKRFSKLVYKDNLTGNVSGLDLNVDKIFQNVFDYTCRLMNAENGSQWFENLMTSWIDSEKQKRDIYSESNYRLNVMAKIYFGNLVVRTAEMIRSGVTDSDVISRDGTYIEYENKSDVLLWYVMHLDQRNMPVFPANDEEGNPQYLPEGCFFMMGDNRFNSFDLRHSEIPEIVSLASSDPSSITYYSIMKPQYVNKNLIIGKPVFRFWPKNRVGTFK